MQSPKSGCTRRPHYRSLRDCGRPHRFCLVYHQTPPIEGTRSTSFWPTHDRRNWAGPVTTVRPRSFQNHRRRPRSRNPIIRWARYAPLLHWPRHCLFPTGRARSRRRLGTTRRVRGWVPYQEPNSGIKQRSLVARAWYHQLISYASLCQHSKHFPHTSSASSESDEVLFESGQERHHPQCMAHR